MMVLINLIHNVVNGNLKLLYAANNKISVKNTAALDILFD